MAPASRRRSAGYLDVNFAAAGAAGEGCAALDLKR
jgi:hypothetical protein